MIRPGRAEDHAAIAELHIASWRSAYRGQVPDAYLGQPVADDLTDRWASRITAPEDVLLVDEGTGGALRGFIYVTGTDEVPYVDNLHVSPALKGGGIGGTLLSAAAAELHRRGRQGLWLTVLASNLPSRAFYEAMGGTVEPAATKTFCGAEVLVEPVRWTDLAALAALRPA